MTGRSILIAVLSGINAFGVTGQTESNTWLKTISGNAIEKAAKPNTFLIAKPGLALYFSVTGKIRMPYLVYVPKTYNPAHPLSLVVFLHGAILARDSFQYKDPAIGDEPIFSIGDELNTIIVFPFARSDYRWSGNSPAFTNVIKIIQQTEEYYNVDKKRIYLGGISMGGNATYWYINHFDEMFAGFYTFSALPGHSYDALKFSNITNERPLYSMNAKDDQVFSYDEAHGIYEQHKNEAPGWVFGTAESGGHRFIYDKDGRQYVKNLVGLLLKK